MFCWIGKVVVVNNSGIIHFGFVKQIAPESISVGSGNGSTTSEQDMEQTGRETEEQANGNTTNNTNGGNGSKNVKGTNGKSKGSNKGNNISISKSKGKATATAPAASKKASPSALSIPSLPFGKSPLGKNNPLSALLKKGFK
ncbi:hypothetical protein PALU110988_20870 [Paenibacillus lupini]|uniref:hypothetical protein n=1 Tax=Paenibacillus lupini TaxID=1450204 RepID=UPI00141FFDCB|nr:hypothetical protein [Paenibacillus lupini]NIK22253.1 hypothetical protein [Paenibacillus lupini]